MSDLELVKQIMRLQKQVDGLVKPEVGRWIDWTPTVTQSGAVTGTISYARYKADLDGMVTVRVYLTITGSGTGNNNIVIGGMPSTIGAANPSSTTVIGHGMVVDFGTQAYTVEMVANGATDWRFYVTGTGSFVGVVPNFALANTDIISFQATYERA